MRPILLLLIFCALMATPSDLLGQPTAATIAAHHYRYVEYPGRVRVLEYEIRLRRAEIASLDRRLNEWEPFDQFRNGRQLFVTIENTRLRLLDTKFDLELLERDLYNLHRYRRYRMASGR